MSMRRADRGAATAEFAVILPVVVAMVALILMVTRAATVAMTCQDAAGTAAGRIAVVENSQQRMQLAQSIVHEVAGSDAWVSIGNTNGSITVETKCAVIPDPLGVLPNQVKGHAVAIQQPEP